MDLAETNIYNNRHPWELSRTINLIKEIQKISNVEYILDIGCGDHYFDSSLASYLSFKELWGVDINLPKNLDNKNEHYRNSYDEIKNKKFDLIIMMDILEHIKDEKEFITNNVLPYLKNDGRIIMTVPAHQFLFGKHDVLLKHYRRYNKKDLTEFANSTDLTINNMYYFYFIPFLIRLFNKTKDNDVTKWPYKEEAWQTIITKNILNVDYSLCKTFSKITTGLSLFATLERKK